MSGMFETLLGALRLLRAPLTNGSLLLSTMVTSTQKFGALFLSGFALISPTLDLRVSALTPPSNQTGVYNSSVSPENLPWNTYNYCNAPHVNAAHYSKPTNVSESDGEPQLVYVNAMIRHHKVCTTHRAQAC